MSKSPRRPKVVREPIQVYLSADERDVLDKLAEDLGLSRAEVLRRGLDSYAVEHAKGSSPVFDLMREMSGLDWPASAENHDELLTQIYLDEMK
jgi:hypothetical protein